MTYHPALKKKSKKAIWTLTTIALLCTSAGIAYSWFISTAYKVHVDLGAGMSYTALVLPDTELKKMLSKEDSLRRWCVDHFSNVEYPQYESVYQCIEKKEPVVTTRFHIKRDFDSLGQERAIYLRKQNSPRKAED